MNPFRQKYRRLALPALAVSAGFHVLLAFVPQSLGGVFFGVSQNVTRETRRLEIIELAPDPPPQYVEHTPGAPGAGEGRVIAPPPPVLRPSDLCGDTSFEPLTPALDTQSPAGVELPLEPALTSGTWASDSSSVLDAYLADVYDRIDRAKHYPETARLLKQEGSVTLAFEINRSGALEGDVRLAGPCRFGNLNRSAVECITRSAPFPPLPDYVLGDTLPFTVSIRFNLRD